MHLLPWVLLTAAVVYANEGQERRSKLPYVADALGNTLPPPSNVPASVGSPVNLLTPDKYEFYTFDESGELVKRLMTLEEIQAIVAAGEETEGLVTFANDNQPTMAFNFSQPPYTKVHSVVTNVQNVLKAQMEAHKNKPHMQPTLDTPDVSDSWSLILPSIFGNTGVDIVPDKTTGSYITPETETIELDPPIDDEDSLGKEGGNEIINSSTQTTVDKIDISSTLTTSTTTQKSTTFKTTSQPTITKRITKPTINTVSKVISTTTLRPKVTSPSTTVTSKPNILSTMKTTVTSTDLNKKRPASISTMKSTVAPSMTHKKPITTTKEQLMFTENSEFPTNDNDQIQSHTHFSVTTERGDIQYERVSTFVPMSAITNLRNGTTKRPTKITKIPTILEDESNLLITSTTYATSIIPPNLQQSTSNDTPNANSQDIYPSLNENIEINNSTTLTTQSVLPSTTTTYTQSLPSEKLSTENNLKANMTFVPSSEVKEREPMLPIFDVAQSISQIASDLGSAYTPITTANDVSESTKPDNMDLESKENIEIDIPTESETNTTGDNFIKISTFDPHDQLVNTTTDSDMTKIEEKKTNEIFIESTTPKNIEVITTLDPVLSESMGDLLSQVVNETPEKDLDDESVTHKEEIMFTTEVNTEMVNSREDIEITTEVMLKNATSNSNGISSISNVVSNASKNNTSSIIGLAKQNISKVEHTTLFSKIISNVKDDMILPSVSTVHVAAGQTKPNKNDEQSAEDKIQSNNENKHGTTIDTQENKTFNTTLPSYKSETQSNDTNFVQKNVYSSHQTNLLENKGHYDKGSNEKEKETQPKVEEFKKKIQKVNIDDKELASDRNNSWKLIPTVSPPKAHEVTKYTKDKPKTENINTPEGISDKNIVLDFSKENQGLELTTRDLGEDIVQFVELCNELAFRYWNDLIETIDKKRSFIFSPYAVTSMLAMMFMGARGATSGEMNDILKLDDMVTFNPHFTLKNISDSIDTNPGSGVAVSAFIRELYSDRSKGKILTFYKERAQHFYNGHVEEVNFKLISDVIRRRTNLLVKRYTWGKLVEFMRTNTIVLQPPLAAFSANIFYTDCSGTSVDGRDGEMYFVVSPNVRQRRLVPVPAVVFKNNFLAGYDPVLDATAAALGTTNSVVSTLFVMPGQQGNIVHAEDLEELEKRLLDTNPSTPAWHRLLRTLLPRVGLELQIPRFSHKSVFNVSSTLKRMGLKDIFDADHADLGGLNGPSKDLYLSDMVQSNTFVTCGEGVIGDQHHIEEYPEQQKRRSARWITGWDEPRDYQRAFHDPHDVGEAMHLPLHLRPRQARLPARNAQPARLKFDRPFLFLVRHNPSGMILYVGRYNPRLLP